MPTVTAGEIDLYYEQQGDGPDLLLIMGLGAHLGAWALQVPAFARHFRVTTFDNRGAGRSAAPDTPYSIRGMADDTAALMTAIGIAPLRYRLTAFALSGAIAGLAGALLAAGQQFISPAEMSWVRSGDLVVMCVLGGMARVWGPVLGAAVFLVLEIVLSGWSTHWQLAFGLLIILVVVSLRGGLIDLLHLVGRRGASR